jgi:hypothetical protein
MEAAGSADLEGVFESPLRFISIVASLLIVTGWLAFAIDQTRDGSEESQQGIVANTVATPAPGAVHHSAARRKLDSINHTLLSPFRSVTGDGASDWMRHSVPAILGLLVYGFGLGYLARFTHGRA